MKGDLISRKSVINALRAEYGDYAENIKDSLRSEMEKRGSE